MTWSIEGHQKDKRRTGLSTKSRNVVEKNREDGAGMLIRIASGPTCAA